MLEHQHHAEGVERAVLKKQFSPLGSRTLVAPLRAVHHRFIRANCPCSLVDRLFHPCNDERR